VTGKTYIASDLLQAAVKISASAQLRNDVHILVVFVSLKEVQDSRMIQGAEDRNLHAKPRQVVATGLGHLLYGHSLLHIESVLHREDLAVGASTQRLSLVPSVDGADIALATGLEGFPIHNF